MALTRLSVSLDAALVEQFDAHIRTAGIPNRSKAVADLIRESLVKEAWGAGERVAGAVVLVYDHHHHDVSRRLTDIQHDHLEEIISTQHIHLGHANCLEIIAVRGQPPRLQSLVRALQSVKGLKHVSIAAATADGVGGTKP